MTKETKTLPKIAQRAITLVNMELRRTISEAAELIGINLNECWEFDMNTMTFVKPDKEKGDDATPT